MVITRDLTNHAFICFLAWIWIIFMGDGSYGTILVLKQVSAHIISELVNAHNFYVF